MSLYQVTLTGPTLELFIGAQIGGAKVVAIKDVSPEMVTAAELAKQYNISVDAVRTRLADVNCGTSGKCLYKPDQAHAILAAKPVAKRGRARKN